jgi:enolase-phosphatase E1
MLAPAAVLTDIEGTTTPPAFIQGVLLPFARQALPDWASRIDLPDVASILAEIRRMVPDQPELTTLQHWSDRDLKLAPLQRLQGMIWEQGYADGDLRGARAANHALVVAASAPSMPQMSRCKRWSSGQER